MVNVFHHQQNYEKPKMEKHVLITGATGMIGKALIQALLKKNYTISILSTHPRFIPNVQVFKWEPQKQLIDSSCFNGVNAIIHLAGENIAKGKWTDSRKKEIIDSRVLSTQLLYNTLKKAAHTVGRVVSASATGFYGDRGGEILTETSGNGNGFLADCCMKWESAVDSGEALGLSIVKLRTGVILAEKEGALPAMAKPVQWFAGAPLGSGKQWVPWIHLQDMVNMYVYALENTFTGTFNACAPYPVTNKTLTNAIAKTFGRPVWPFSVPAKLIKLILGEMAVVALISTNTSAQKILDAGFTFKFTQLPEALSDIYAS
jgi:uncharacterized protein (TIGR01777 family)